MKVSDKVKVTVSFYIENELALWLNDISKIMQTNRSTCLSEMLNHFRENMKHSRIVQEQAKKRPKPELPKPKLRPKTFQEVLKEIESEAKHEAK